MERKILLTFNNARVKKYLIDKLPEVEILSGDVSAIENINPNIVVVLCAPGKSLNDCKESVQVAISNKKIVVVGFGVVNEVSQPVYDDLINMGVPKELILTSSPGKTVSSSQLLKGIQDGLDLIEDEDDPPLFEDVSEFEEEVQKPEIISKKPGILVRVFSFKRGSGNTTVAASICAHLKDSGLNPVIVDAGMPATAAFHMKVDNPSSVQAPALYSSDLGDLVIPECVGDFHSILEELKDRYDVIIVNQPGVILPIPGCNISVVVLDQDIQSVELTLEKSKILQLGREVLFVINKANPLGVPVDIIAGVDGLNTKPVVIDSDYGACNTALAEYLPAISKSDKVAKGVGEIVAHLKLLGEV